jgi:hypothetical protein
LSTDHFQELEVNYLKPIDKVFADATRYCIRTAQSLAILNDVCHNDLVISSTWPTWVTQWKAKQKPFILQNIKDFSAMFRACADTKVSFGEIG